MADDSCAYLEPKVERDQDGLHLITSYRNKTSLRLVFSPTARQAGLSATPSISFANLFLVEKRKAGKVEGEREVQQACCCCCVCEKISTTVAAAQFGVYAGYYVCTIQQQFIDDT